MKRIIYGIALLLISLHVYGLDKPDTLEIMYWHSSIGQRIFDVYDAGFKRRADSLGQTENWPLKIFDYRSNSPEAADWAGWRTAEFNPDQYGDNRLGWTIHFGFGSGISPMELRPGDHTSFWDDYSLDTANVKGRMLLKYNIYDTTQVPDTFVVTTEYDILLFEICYFHFKNLNDDSLTSYKNQYLNWRDSAVKHPDKIFLYHHATPLKLEGQAQPDSADRYNAMKLDIWCRDTLVKKAQYPNFLFWSYYDALVEEDIDSTNFGCLKTIYESTGSDDHPNTAACQFLQDTIITSWLPELLEYLENYYSPEKRVRRFRK